MGMAAVVNHLIGEVALPSRIAPKQSSFEKLVCQIQILVALQQVPSLAPHISLHNPPATIAMQEVLEVPPGHRSMLASPPNVPEPLAPTASRLVIGCAASVYHEL
jgi:hypothetical protein